MSNTDWNNSILSPFVPHNKETSFDGAWESLYFEWENADGFNPANEQITKTLFSVFKITDPILISYPICFFDHMKECFGDLVKSSNMGSDLPCFFDGMGKPLSRIYHIFLIVFVFELIEKNIEGEGHQLLLLEGLNIICKEWGF